MVFMSSGFIKSLFLLFFLLVLPVAEAMADEEIKAEIRYLHVQPGQTLHNIVSKLYPTRRTEWPRLRQDIIRLNPHAFVGGKETQMKAGVKLTLPKPVVAKAKLKKAPPKYVGDVVLARGQAIAVGKDKKTRALSAGKQVFVGDKLITGVDGFVRLKMIDKALLDLRCYSIMVIEDYELKSTNSKSVLNLLQGSLRKVTGEIGKWQDDVYELRTPVAGVGVRGTEYALRVFQSKGCDGSVDTGDDGLYVKVIKGIVDVHSKKTKKKTEVVKGDNLYIKTADSKPVRNVVKPGVVVPLREEPKPQPEEDDSISSWWWLLALGLLAL
jgi:hypothetical protein